jgi:hypothetical protein
MMMKLSRRLVALAAFAAFGPAQAQTLDALQGKFGFNWRSNPARQKCVRIAGPLLADFRSAKFKCDLTVKSNSSSGEKFRLCTATARRGAEYMIFDTMKSCEEERKTQEAAE